MREETILFVGVKPTYDCNSAGRLGLLRADMVASRALQDLNYWVVAGYAVRHAHEGVDQVGFRTIAGLVFPLF